MRGRFLLSAALLILLVPSTQALSAADAGPAGPVARGLSPPEVVAAKASDPCVDVSSVFDDPSAVVTIAAQCTVVVSVSVRLTDDGRIIVTIVVAYAEYGYTFVVECSDPDHWPQPGDTWTWYGPCSKHELEKAIQ